MGPALPPSEILATLRELNNKVSVPLWLFGGVAVDFLVGRWTRPHGDVDLHALAEHRGRLTQELSQIGYTSPDATWLTHWYQPATGRRLEIVFLEREADGLVALRIAPDSPVGVPGFYPLARDYLAGDRFASLGGVTFRVPSPAGEWLARAAGWEIVGGRPPEAKLAHDRELLEGLIPAEELARLMRTRSNQPPDDPFPSGGPVR